MNGMASITLGRMPRALRPITRAATPCGDVDGWFGRCVRPRGLREGGIAVGAVRMTEGWVALVRWPDGLATFERPESLEILG